MASAQELVYGEGSRAIQHQMGSLDELRARTGLLLASAAISASLLGEQAFRDFDALAVLGLLGFLGVIGLSLAILWPRADWRFALGSRILIEDWLEEPVSGDVDAMTVFLARQHELNWLANQDRLNRMFTYFQIAILALGAEVVFWTLHLA